MGFIAVLELAHVKSGYLPAHTCGSRHDGATKEEQAPHEPNEGREVANEYRRYRTRQAQEATVDSLS